MIQSLRENYSEIKTKKLPGFVRLPKPIPPPEAAGWFTVEGIDIHAENGVWTGAGVGWKDW